VDLISDSHAGWEDTVDNIDLSSRASGIDAVEGASFIMRTEYTVSPATISLIIKAS
jgi:hypothetical protein